MLSRIRWTLLLAAGALLLFATPSTQAEPAYAGSDLCLECHEDYQATLTGTGHGSSFYADLSGRAHPSAVAEGAACETCHGPGEAHVDDPEANSMRVTDLTTDEQSEMCQSCHSGSSQFFWGGGEHEAQGLSGLSCHSVHSPASPDGQLQQASQSEQCFSCHKDIRAQSWKTSHHPVREGQMSCGDCHNPHGSPTEGMLREASVNEQCYSCHAEKRGPFLWEHAPVREDCLTCHNAHGSNHTKLKVAEVPYLCQSCHANTRHPGTLYDGTRVVGGMGESNRLINRGCVNCHNAIHGSNHPSSPYLSH